MKTMTVMIEWSAIATVVCTMLVMAAPVLSVH